MSMRKTALCAAVRRHILFGLCVIPAISMAAEQETGEHEEHEHALSHDVLEEVRVTATPLDQDLEDMSQSAAVLRGAELNRQLSNNLGESLALMPGMSNASFGENVGRPVIRGFEGSRVGVLSNNMSASDASAVSQDHAVSVEPFMADQIEVLRGPATLLYGSGAIGGVVNIVTNTIPKEVPEEGVEGRVMAQGDTAADQRFLAARLDGGSGSFAFHVNAFDRTSDDYEIPGAAELYPEEAHDDNHDDHDDHEGEEEVMGILENSYLDNRGGALGASFIGDKWRFGASWTRYDSDYGIPGGHAHGHGEEHEGEHEEDHDEDHEEHEEEEEKNVTIDLEQDRYDFELVGQQPLSGFDELKVLVSQTSYEHTEFEGDEVGTLFESDTLDSRVELTHEPWGDWRGAFGLQWTEREFTAIGEEAFVPPSETTTLAVFWLEQIEFEALQLEFGLRYEDIEVEAEAHEGQGHHDEHEEEAHEEDEHEAEGGMQRRSFTPFSASAGAIWHLDERSHISLSIASVTRAPSDQELFSNGPHAATQTFEIGDPNLRKERNTHLEAGYRLHGGAFTASVSVFYDAFSDYIYERDTGEEEDGLPVRKWSQQDASFWGGEVEVRLDLGEYDHGHWQVYGFGDMVRAEFDDNSDVPRIPPSRLGAGVEWHLGSWSSNLSWVHASRQDRVADYETPTPGYDLLDLDLIYRLPFGGRSTWELFGKGRNLLDEDVRNHTSFLKDEAPQIGRNFVMGIRGTF